MRLSLQLPILVGSAVLLTAVAGGVIAVTAAGSTATSQALRSTEHDAQLYAHAVAGHVDDASLALEVAASRGQSGQPVLDVGRWRDVAQVLLNRSQVFEYVLLLRPDGSIAMVEPAQLEGSLITPTVARQPWYGAVVATRDTVVSDLHISSATARPTVVIATPLEASDGALVGIWAGGLSLQSVSAFGRVAGEGPAAASSGLLTDGRGLIIAHANNPGFVRDQTDFSSVLPVRRALAGQTSSGRWHDPIENVEKLGAWLPVSVGDARWAAVYSTPVEDALAPVRRLTRDIGLSIVAVAVVMGLVGSLVGRRITRPLHELSVAAGRVAAGDLEVRTPSAHGEIGELAAGLNTMIAAVAQRDETLRDQAARLVSSEARFRNLVEGAPDAIVIVDEHGTIQLVNKQAEGLFGYDRDDLPGQPVDVLVPERFRAAHAQHFRRYLAAPATREMAPGTLLLGRRKDGSEVAVEVALSPTQDERGRLNVSAAVRDATDRRRLMKELEEANREFEAFAYSVSHDLRAPLRSIDGFSQVLREDYGAGLDSVANQHLDRIRAAAQRMGTLIDDLLNLSRVTNVQLQVERVDLAAISRRLVDDLQRSDRNRLLVLEVDERLIADADPRMAEIVMRNLLDNAWKFTSKTPEPHIHVGAQSPGCFFVSDNGAGFDMAGAERLFTIFQRLHTTSDFPGSGVGLATVSRVLRRHGGDIWAHAAPGAGATFTFTFTPPASGARGDADDQGRTTEFFAVGQVPGDVGRAAAD